MSKIISRFRDEYDWLSNFYLCPIYFENDLFISVENAFQAAKTYKLDRKRFLNCPPKIAKKLGRIVPLRKDWDIIKDYIMETLIAEKFRKGTELAAKLIDTGDDIITHENDHYDIYWGKYKGVGKDKLGIILMKQRDFLQR